MFVLLVGWDGMGRSVGQPFFSARSLMTIDNERVKLGLFCVNLVFLS